jgi:Ca2+-binding RTX toxin-like protein
LRGGFGTDFLRGGSASDVLLGGWGRDRMAGGLGRDGLEGQGRGDVLLGQRGNDSLHVETSPGDSVGEDLLKGGRGADYFYLDFDGMADVIDCGPGEDLVQRSRIDEADTFIDCERFIGV